jgi:hypothetical protein
MNTRPAAALAAICLGILILTGCAGRFERPNIPSVVVVPAPHGIGNYTIDNYKADLAAYDLATGDSAKALRNRMVYQLFAEIDYVFYDYETKLFLNQGRFNVGSDFLQLGLAAGATITNGARAKTILSALLSGVTGTSLSIDKNFFRQQTVQAIASSMEANRDKVKAVILQELTQDNTTYPFSAARAELIKYFFAGTLSSGLQQIHQDSAASAQTAQANLQQVQVGNIPASDVSAVTELNKAIAKAFADNELTKVTAWLRAMKALTADTPTRATIEQAFRDLGRKAAGDPDLRKQYFDEARRAGLIQ